MKTSRLTTAALASLIALTLAACTPANDPEPSASSSAAVSDSPTPMPSPTDVPSPSQTAEAAPNYPCPGVDDGGNDGGNALIAAHRYAGVCVGDSFDQASAAMGSPLTGLDVCPWITQLVSAPSIGLFVEAISFVEAPGEEIFMFRMGWLDDPATAPENDPPATAEDISIGSTAAEVLAAYPAGETIVREDMSAGNRDQIVVPVTPDLTYVFDVTGGLVNTIYWGERLSFGAQAELCAL